MANLQSTIADNEQAVTAFIAAARGVSQSAWIRPRAPGKWSPSQVTEHVCIAYELARDVLVGKPGVGSAPWFLRPIIRTFFLKPVLKTGRFRAGAKAPAPFQPTGSPASAVELVARLRAAADAFGSEVNAAGRDGRTTVDHPLFGSVPLSDYSRLQAIHTRHHAAQLGGDPK